MCVCDSNVPRLQGSSPSDALLLSGKFELLCLKQARGINISNKKDRSILSRHIIVFIRLKQKKSSLFCSMFWLHSCPSRWSKHISFLRAILWCADSPHQYPQGSPQGRVGPSQSRAIPKFHPHFVVPATQLQVGSISSARWRPFCWCLWLLGAPLARVWKSQLQGFSWDRANQDVLHPHGYNKTWSILSIMNSKGQVRWLTLKRFLRPWSGRCHICVRDQCG